MEYQRLEELVNQNEWDEACRELDKYVDGEWDDQLAVLAAATCFALGDQDGAFECIVQGLKYNYKNYELYLMLGNYYEQKNCNQAWLCYQNALYYCDNEQDYDVILQYKQRMEQNPDWCVQKVSIVILTYNLKEMNIQCICSLRDTNDPSSYELIVVDNASTDGTLEWLEEQPDIKLIGNRENKGFPAGCNQGIKAAEPENDILLLNNDTLILPNAIFWLRMGLYEEKRIGATGSMSNWAIPRQQIEQKLDSVEAYIAYGTAMNIPMKNAMEKKVWLAGFALLVKRKALDEVGLLDERYSPGQSEDLDLCVRMNLAGWQVRLCHNSFIIHYGHGNGKNTDVWKKTSSGSYDKFKKKWGFDLSYYTYSRRELVDMITQPKEEAISVLEIGCGCGATLAHIAYEWPHSKVCGVEIQDAIARIGANALDIVQGDIETMPLTYEKQSFDYIIFADVLEHLRDPEKILKRLAPYLKENGKYLCSVPNILNKHVISNLLMGELEYQDAGILDRTHLRFFTLDSITKAFKRCGFEIAQLMASYDNSALEPEEEELLAALYRVPHLADREQFRVYQYYVCAQKMQENV